MVKLLDRTAQASLVLREDTGTHMGTTVPSVTRMGATVMDTEITLGMAMLVATDIIFMDIKGSMAMSSTADTMPHRM